MFMSTSLVLAGCLGLAPESVLLPVPNPVTARDVSRMCASVGAGGAVIDSALDLLLAHREEVDGNWAELRRQIGSLGVDLAEIQDAAYREVEVADVWRSGYQTRSVLADGMLALESRFFERWELQVQGTPIEEQIPLLMARWKRWQCVMPMAMVPGGDLQLDVFLLDTLPADTFEEHGIVLRALLDRYDMECGDLHRRRSEARVDAEATAPMAFARLWLADTDETRKEGKRKFQDVARRPADLDRVLSTRNFETLEEFAATLRTAGAPDAASALTDAYLAKVFPKVHPDPTDPRSIVEEWLDARSTSEGDLPDARALLLASIQQRAEICQAMRREVIEYSHRLAVTRSLEEAGQSRHEETMKRLAAQRVALTVALRDALAPEMPPEVRAAIDRLIPKDRNPETQATPAAGAGTR